MRYAIPRAILKLVSTLGFLFVTPAFLLAIYVISRGNKDGLVWGHTPIINNKYWSHALHCAGFHSWTLMSGYYNNINNKSDYDLYFDDIFPQIKSRLLRGFLQPWLVMLYLAKHVRILHLPFYGGVLSNTLLWKLESYLYRIARIKTVIIPYGADIYMYSKIFDPCIRNGLLLSYPQAARNEKRTRARVEYWTKNADVILMGFTLEGIGRWDVPAGNFLSIDVMQWVAKREYSMANGQREKVRILHNPNHTGVKGSEFIVNAIDILCQKGLKVELVMLQGVPNAEVQTLLQQVDIHADQLILPGYGMSAVEAMASGLPVIANLSDHRYTTIFRRFSYLAECPIFSSTPETIVEDLEMLVTNPDLRRQLGVAGRKYVEKYHSYEMAQYLFRSVYDKILKNTDVDLMNLFHPLKSEYNKRKPIVQHPLIENRLPRK